MESVTGDGDRDGSPPGLLQGWGQHTGGSLPLSTPLPVAGTLPIPITTQITCSQLWVHIRITWGAFPVPNITAASMPIKSESLGVESGRESFSLQVIPVCSHVGDLLYISLTALLHGLTSVLRPVGTGEQGLEDSAAVVPAQVPVG